MILDIVVPHYKESIDIVKPFFEVLKAQKGVDFDDFRVWLIHDGVGPTPEEQQYYNEGPLNVHQVFLPHGGVSACRNYGLEHSNADWICFCDCDDCYTSIFSLMMVMHVLTSENANQYDVIWGSFYMHGLDKLVISDKFNSVFIHNKYYRRSFLIEHDIRFSEELYMSEDSAFNTVIRMELPMNRIGMIKSDYPLYAWCRRPGSITMDFSKWLFNAEGHFKRNLYVLDEYRKRGIIDCTVPIARTFTDAYAMLNKKGVEGDKSYLINQLRAFYKKEKLFYRNIPKETIEEGLKTSDRDACITQEDKDLRPSFEKWMGDHVMK